VVIEIIVFGSYRATDRTAIRISDFQSLIIGGGSSGAVLANRLSASGTLSILLLEAGGDPNPVSDVPLARRHVLSSSDFSVVYYSVPQENSCLEAGVIKGNFIN